MYNIWQKHIHKECMTSTAYLYTKVGSSSTFKREVHRHAIRWCYWVELLDCETLSEQQTKEIYQTRVEFPCTKQLPVKLSLRVKAPVKTDTELPWYDQKNPKLVFMKFSCCLDKNASMWCIGVVVMNEWGIDNNRSFQTTIVISYQVFLTPVEEA